jgi:hypothetical protein
MPPNQDTILAKYGEFLRKFELFMIFESQHYSTGGLTGVGNIKFIIISKSILRRSSGAVKDDTQMRSQSAISMPKLLALSS